MDSIPRWSYARPPAATATSSGPGSIGGNHDWEAPLGLLPRLDDQLGGHFGGLVPLLKRAE